MQPFWSFGSSKWNCSGPSPGNKSFMERMLQIQKWAAQGHGRKQPLCLRVLKDQACPNKRHSGSRIPFLRKRMSLKGICKESPPRKSKTCHVTVSKTISMVLLPSSPMPCLWIWIHYTSWHDKGALMDHLPPEKCINRSLMHTLQRSAVRTH